MYCTNIVNFINIANFADFINKSNFVAFTIQFIGLVYFY